MLQAKSAISVAATLLVVAALQSGLIQCQGQGFNNFMANPMNGGGGLMDMLRNSTGNQTPCLFNATAQQFMQIMNQMQQMGAFQQMGPMWGRGGPMGPRGPFDPLGPRGFRGGRGGPGGRGPPFMGPRGFDGPGPRHFRPRGPPPHMMMMMMMWNMLQQLQQQQQNGNGNSNGNTGDRQQQGPITLPPQISTALPNTDELVTVRP